jgi:peptidoglycan/xylan/chitin deacetylase (PgdA/CDA1 family)
MRANSLPVLLYHHVGPERLGTYPSLTVPPAQFRRQIAWLVRRGYRSITIDEVVRWKADRDALSGRRVLLTFDDAYADVVEWAFPVLLGAELSAVVFVATARIGQTNLWDADLGGQHRIMTEAQIKEWSKRGVEFGAHTRTHADVTGLPEADARKEMAASKADLEALVDRPVVSFAYPYGVHNDRVARTASSIFHLAFTADPGRNDAATDPYRIRRSMVSPGDTALQVELRACLGFSPKERARAWLSAKRRRGRGGA